MAYAVTIPQRKGNEYFKACYSSLLCGKKIQNTYSRLKNRELNQSRGNQEFHIFQWFFFFFFFAIQL